MVPYTTSSSFPWCTLMISFLAVLISGLTTCQCITPQFTDFKKCLHFPNLLFPPKHAQFCQAWFLHFPKTNWVIFMFTTWFIFPLPERFFSLSFVKLICLSNFISWHIFRFPDLTTSLIYISTAFQFSITSWFLVMICLELIAFVSYRIVWSHRLDCKFLEFREFLYF